MKPDLEFVGKNVQSAVQSACEKLKVSPNDLQYDILSNGSSGIFGLVGVKKARIRVRPTAEQQSKESDQKQSTEVKDSMQAEVKSLVDEAFQISDSSVPKNKKAFITKSAPPTEEEPPIDLSDEAIQTGKQALLKIVQCICQDADVNVSYQDGRVQYNVLGGNPGVLIGKRGQNLEAIQYLIDKIVNKRSERRIRLQVDIEGYLKTRQENLIKLAERLAEKTKRTGRPSTIGQISAQDRRIVHLTLKLDKEVRTQSIGDGYYRKLVIFPKKGTYKKKKNSHKVTAEQ